MQAVALQVVHQRQAAAHVPGVVGARALVLEQGPRPAQACSARAWRKPGTSTSPASSICCTSSWSISRSSGLSPFESVVPMTQTVRIGTRMSPSPGGLAAVDHRGHQPVVHRDHDPLARHHGHARAAGHVGDLAGPDPAGVDDERGLDAHLVPATVVPRERAHGPVAVAQDLGDPVIGEDAGAVLLGRSRVAPQQLPGIDRGVGHLEGARDARVDPGLAGQRLGDRDLLHRHAGGRAAREEPVGVVGVVGRRGDEEAAGVLDRLAGDAAQDDVLLGALGGRPGVAHHVAPAGVQQAVEAPGGALAEIHPLDQDRAEAPHGGVAHDPEAGRAAADDEDVTFEGLDQPPPSSSTQSNDLVTAFFQCRYSVSRWAASMDGFQRLSSTQFSRRSSTSAHMPTARPAA